MNMRQIMMLVVLGILLAGTAYAADVIPGKAVGSVVAKLSPARWVCTPVLSSYVDGRYTKSLCVPPSLSYSMDPAASAK